MDIITCKIHVHHYLSASCAQHTRASAPCSTVKITDERRRIPSYDDMIYLIIINVTHISMFRNYSFNFERNVTKRGRNMERHWECNIAEPKFELKSFCPSSCVFYGRDHI